MQFLGFFKKDFSRILWELELNISGFGWKFRNYFLLTEKFVEVSDDLVEEAEALDALVVAVKFDVELVEVGNRRKQDPHAGITLKS